MKYDERKEWLLCEKCNTVLEPSDLKYTNFNHNCPVENDPGPDYGYCPHCGNDNLAEVHECLACHELKEIVTLMEDGYYLCDDCPEEKYWQALDNEF